jgi:hypothetical protein
VRDFGAVLGVGRAEHGHQGEEMLGGEERGERKGCGGAASFFLLNILLSINLNMRNFFSQTSQLSRPLVHRL